VSNQPPKISNSLKEKLQKQQTELEKEIKSIEKGDPLNGDGLAESSEPGTDSWLADMHGRTLALKDNLRTILGRTKKALLDLKSGKYGKCENCGKQIEAARLEALPTATLCLACSRKKLKK
jgi:DnaK suppressor protein